MTCMALVRLGILFMNDLGMGQQVRLVVIHLQSHARMSSSRVAGSANPTLANNNSATNWFGIGSQAKRNTVFAMITLLHFGPRK